LALTILLSFPHDLVIDWNVLAGATWTMLERESIFSFLLETDHSVEDAIKSLGIESVDSGDIEVLCRELLDTSTPVIGDVKSGRQ
jgi:hypothetical protein